jgi:intein/homing endonuclease
MDTKYFGKPLEELNEVDSAFDAKKAQPQSPPVDIHSNLFPPLPNFKPIVTVAEREQMFGKFDYAIVGGGNIKILGDWVKENIILIDIPQLVGMPTYGTKPFNGKVWVHKLAADPMKCLFASWEASGLIDRVIFYGGCYVPRLVRGSDHVVSNHCLPESEKVYTEDGLMSIKDLEKYNGRVYSYRNGNIVLNKMTEFFKNGSKKILKIKVNGHTIRCSEDHQLLTLVKKTLSKDEFIQHKNGRGQKRALYYTEMKKAKNLTKDDRLICVKNFNKNEDPTRINSDWAEIIGLFLGDGCINHKRNIPEFVTFCFPKQDRVRDYVINKLTAFFNESPKETNESLIYNKEKIFKQFLQFDKKARQKELPIGYEKWDKEAQISLFKGLLYSDGFVGRSKSSAKEERFSARYGFKFGSKKLTEQIRYLCILLGMRVTNIHTDKEEDGIVIAGNKPCLRSERYSFFVTDYNLIIGTLSDEMYSKRISEAPQNKSYNTKCWGYEVTNPNFIHKKIKSIEADGYEKVYDITVENDHNFIVDGIVVSNSWGSAFDLNTVTNPMGSKPPIVGQPGCLRELVPMANNQGWFWGGHFKNRPDGMHFELTILD